jgi:hypothetical protein
MNGGEPPCKSDPHQRRRREQRQHRPREPRIAHAAPGEREQQQHRRQQHHRGPDHVELVRPVVARNELQRAVGHQHGDDAERQVDPEDERPVQIVGEEAAGERAEDRRGHEHHRRIALEDRALARRQDVGDHGLRQRQDAAAAKALQRAREDQHPHRRRERAGERAEKEDRERDQHHRAAAVDVGELAEQRRRDRRRQQIRGHHPGEVLDVVEAAPDRRQRRRDDGLLQRREEHRQHQPGDDRPDGGVVERPVRFGWRRGRAHVGRTLYEWCSTSCVRHGRAAGSVGSLSPIARRRRA